MSRLCQSWLGRLFAMLPLAVASTLAFAQTWHIETASTLLEPANRYIGVLVATNRSDVPIYVRAKTFKILVENGKRRQSEDGTHMLSVYPAEFVLQPQSSFNVRLVANISKIEGPGQSFYVRLTDVSNIAARGQGGMSNGVLYAYDTLVAVSKTRSSILEPAAFAVLRDPAGGAALANQSLQHVFLQAGYRCGTDRQQLVDCEQMLPFPSQSLLPGEVLALPELSTPYFGLLLLPTMSAQSRPRALMIPASLPTVSAEPRGGNTPATP